MGPASIYTPQQPTQAYSNHQMTGAAYQTQQDPQMMRESLNAKGQGLKAHSSFHNPPTAI